MENLIASSAGGLGDNSIMSLSFGPFVMLLSALFYLICTLYIWKVKRNENNELLSALFAFMVYQTIGILFMGVEWYTDNHTFGLISSLVVFIGSAYMFKFLFASFSSGVRKTIFYLSLAVLIGLFTWFLTTPERKEALPLFTMWYDVIVNGIVVGGAIVLFGLSSKSGIARKKSLAGGVGVICCCVIGNIAVVSGAFITSAIFQFLAPVFILGALMLRKKS